ncbi:MAG: glycosyltransferase [Candidatus Omnitrophica bacterium]|nr:glycosyltransferase [Candidatus Omnitrophota bacterium]
MSLLIIGMTGGTHIGGSLCRAAKELGIAPSFLDAESAFRAPRPIRRFCWRLMRRRPPRLHFFSKQVLGVCMEDRPARLLATGIAPIDKGCLQRIGGLGVRRICYLTDDPWNNAHYAPWFIGALKYYDDIFSTRRANIDDLKKIGCKNVEYLPFGYDPELFYPEKLAEEERQRYVSDIVFVGGADDDRVSYISVLINAGFNVGLYGGYWDKYGATKNCTRGIVDTDTARKVISSAKVALCLVRRANRDGSCMRTFEVPASGACMLTEDTQEHRELFGEEGRAVIYFKTPHEMTRKAGWLMSHDNERRRLAEAAYRLVVGGKNRYKDRLVSMLKQKI